MRFRLAAIFLVTILAVPLALAQQGTSQMRGHVTAGDGSALPGVSVTIKHEESGVVRMTITDAEGVYFMSGITPGKYELTAELSGFKPVRRHDIRTEVGKTTSVDVKLDMGAAAEEITVTAAAPIIDVTSKEVGGNITDRELTELPSVNRNFIGFVGLLPGVVPNISTESFGSDSVSVNGQDPRNNNYLVDGGNNNDDVIGQRAGTQARTPLEAIQEFQVLTGQYDAEFGRTTGGVINAVTKQGSNSIKGVVFGFLQDAKYASEDVFGNKPDTRFVQYGGTVGGPIIQDKLHFFASLERVENNRANSLIIAARPEIVEPTTQDRVWNTMIRLDHQINPTNTWAVRWLREESPQTNQIIGNVTPAASREESDVDQTAVAHMTSVIGTSKLNTVRASWTQENVAFANAAFNGNGRNQGALPATLNFLTYTDQQSNVAQSRVDDAYALDDTFNWYANKHDMKFGINYESVKEHAVDEGNLNGTFTFRSDKPFNAADPSTYPERFSIRVPGASDLRLKVHYFTLFGQDKWDLNDQTTLSFGLRYDRERIPIDESNNPLFANGQGAPNDDNNWSPRVGITYELPGAKTTLLRGGVGRFYDKTHLELLQGVMTSGYFSNSFTATFPANGPDPGPSTGKLPTDPTLVNGPVVNPALIAALFPPGAKIRNTGTVLFDSPDRVVPYTDQLSIGVQREILSGMSLNLDYVHAEGRDQFMSRELNPATRANTARNTPIVRTNPAFINSTLVRTNDGETTYDALEFQLDHHLGAVYQYRVSYTYSRSQGNTSGNGVPTSPFQYLGDLRLDANDGPTDFDRPHNFVVSGSWAVPHTGGLTLAAVGRYLSGDPFTIQNTNFDLDQNGVLFDPVPAGQYEGGGNKYSTDGGRNGARGPDFMQIDTRVGYRIPAHGVQVELIAEIFNLTDRANFTAPNGDVRSGAANFLQNTALRAGAVPRTMQFGVRMSY
jgi:outer membrane receptor protein involved in Fe transport